MLPLLSHLFDRYLFFWVLAVLAEVVVGVLVVVVPESFMLIVEGLWLLLFSSVSIAVGVD